ncbi:hypothetical protein PPYR_04790 [Photinus pyralis]|uniref:Adenylyltransferase and sulfurtransferase MOCS3 homolog n=1 Tax=Photinus pyralis TaxID=7054 RepID=A0A1Y1M4G9_PHOPY|nr:adenylyltransferase and sulfurtransferase MOCS3-like [Photinus pyralis]XP_031358680.1 adenylyltransferase and sulfurtransferase MOCS3-like [Photinus pyralis]KAB0790789.1 hypothetical protein PPYR_15299 [Photinus pyralis]KAB0802604.1 hypothetical protein PPYR_04790 [Photinus pyralis]
MPEETEVEQLEKEIEVLKQELKQKEARLQLLKSVKKQIVKHYSNHFTTDEITRYSRQMLVPAIGVAGQNALKQSNVLIVGAGGLGCPAALYLVAAGVGHLTIVDNDEVELTNLHRQILHTEADVGVPKVESALGKLSNINSNVKVNPLHLHVNSESLMGLLTKENFDVVIDCTDNVPTRYLLNDACVLKKIPLVSGSALQLEGQLTVYNYKNGPCYRCLFPVPPAPDSVTSCGDGGVVGIVPGVIGSLQALETVKIIADTSGVLNGRLLLFDGSNTTFRNVKLRNKNLDCQVCGSHPSITKLIDYEQFCGTRAHDKVINIEILSNSECMNVIQFSKVYEQAPIVIDVRPSVEYEMCHLTNSINIPYQDIEKDEHLDFLKELLAIHSGEKDVYVLCRRGNDSQRAVVKLRDQFRDSNFTFLNITGGLHSFAKQVDPAFPIY